MPSSPVNSTDFLLDDTDVTFDLFSVAHAMQNATIRITEDDVLEGAHNFNVSIVSASPAPNVIVGSPSSAVVIIDDNDGEYYVESFSGEEELFTQHACTSIPLATL